MAKKMTLEEKQERINELENREKTLSINEKIELQKLRKEVDKETSPVVAAGVFVTDTQKQENAVEFIPLKAIELMGFKDRSGIIDEGIRTLADSIKANGLLQPIVVQELEPGRYRKIAGRRRMEASILIGEEKIKAIVKRKELSEEEILLMVLHENTEREELSIYDRVRSIVNLIAVIMRIGEEDAVKMIRRADNFLKGNLDKSENINKEIVEQIMSILKKSNLFGTISNITKHLSVLNMPDEVLKAINDNKISFPLAKVLTEFYNQCGDIEKFKTITQKIIDEKMNPEEAKTLIRENMDARKTSVADSKEEVRIKFKDTMSNVKKSFGKLEEKRAKEMIEKINEILKEYS